MDLLLELALAIKAKAEEKLCLVVSPCGLDLLNRIKSIEQTDYKEVGVPRPSLSVQSASRAG